MDFLRKFITGILGFFLVIALYLLPFTIAINSTLLNPNFIISFLTQLDYSKIIDQALASGLKEGLPVQIPEENLNHLKKELINILDENVGLIITNFYQYLNNETDSFNPVIDIKETKQKIKTDVFEVYKNFIPSAEYEQNKKTIDKQIESTWNKIAGEIPDKLDLKTVLGRTESESVLQNIRQGISIYKTIRTGVIVFLIIGFLIVGLIQFKLKGLLNAYSRVVITAGALTLLTYLSSFVLLRFSTMALSELPIQALQIDSLLTGIKSFIRTFLVCGIVYLVAGIGMQISTNVIKAKPAPTIDDNL